MDFSEKIGLLHHVADTIRSGGDIDINQYGELELRSAGVAERLLRKISVLAGMGEENKFKISEDALTQVSSLCVQGSSGTWFRKPKGSPGLSF